MRRIQCSLRDDAVVVVHVREPGIEGVYKRFIVADRTDERSDPT